MQILCSAKALCQSGENPMVCIPPKYSEFLFSVKGRQMVMISKIWLIRHYGFVPCLCALAFQI